MDPGAIADLLRDYSVPVSVVALLVGLANCFLGYRIFRFVLGLVGFILGAAAGAMIGGYIGDGGELATIIGALVGGFIGAVLLVVLYFLGVFLFGAAVGAMLVGVIGSSLGYDMPVVAVIVGAVILGIVAVALQRVVIILGTALSGSWTAVVGGYALIQHQSLEIDQFWTSVPWEEPLVPIIVWLVLALAGAVVQFRSKT